MQGNYDKMEHRETLISWGGVMAGKRVEKLTSDFIISRQI